MAHTNDDTPRPVRRARRRRVLAIAAAGLLIGVGAAGTALADHGAGGERVDGTPCSAAARACVDLASGRAWLLDDGEVDFGPVQITHGGRGTETPTGDFAVYDKDRDHRSFEFDGAEMPWSVFFAPGGIAFHQGNQNVDSAGCVKLERNDAVRFFTHLDMNDRVEVR